MILRGVTIEGRPADVVYLDVDFAPANKEDAVLVKVVFTDAAGGALFAARVRPPEAPGMALVGFGSPEERDDVYAAARASAIAGGADEARVAQAGREAVAQLRALGKAAGRKTLYVKRRLLNPEDVRAWAAAQGIASTLRPDDMHVTVAFSREPVDWSEIAFEQDGLAVLEHEGPRAVHQFPPRSTPNGALVLKFESPELRARWQYFRDHGASWDFPEYQPHVTLTYSVPEADAGAIEPYRGPLVFGPEEAAEVDDGWAGELVEEPTSMIPVKDRWAPQGG